jgi:hypothetical protein
MTLFSPANRFASNSQEEVSLGDKHRAGIWGSLGTVVMIGTRETGDKAEMTANDGTILDAELITATMMTVGTDEENMIADEIAGSTGTLTEIDMLTEAERKVTSIEREAGMSSKVTKSTSIATETETIDPIDHRAIVSLEEKKEDSVLADSPTLTPSLTRNNNIINNLI